ncbi:ArsR family transcriptional regulator [Paenibacillus alvei]|uniref:helix-turn-helix transcriptional regulator n=1 Tax=Paenibacillus alvei TaxID=44250 RepID=UPI003D29BDCE
MTITQQANMINHSARRNILLFLKQQGTVGVPAIAKHLQLTAIAVRRHLYALQKGGYVHAHLIRQQLGRPTYEYSLTDKASMLFVSAYDTLIIDILEQLQEQSGEDTVEELFHYRRQKQEKRYAPLLNQATLEERICALAALQDKEGYMVRWGRWEDGSYWLEEANCPISQVAAQFGSPCRCEQSMFATVLHADVDRTECIVEGGTRCMFRIVDPVPGELLERPEPEV